MAGILVAVEAEIAGLAEVSQVSWPAQVARTLAAELDVEPNASMARELRSVMGALMAGSQPAKVDAVDEIAAARRARRAKVSNSS